MSFNKKVIYASDKYNGTDGNVVAKDMTLEVATTLIGALFEKYYNDKKLFISIRRMDWDEPEES